MKPIPILMAEDDQEDQLLVKIALEEARLNNPIYFVNNGAECLDYLYQRRPFDDTSAYPVPGLIILDLNMPKKNGLTTLKEIKSDHDLAHIPVIILTTSNEESEVAESYCEGAASFISKPISLEKLIEIMRHFGKYWFSIVEISDQHE